MLPAASYSLGSWASRTNQTSEGPTGHWEGAKGLARPDLCELLPPNQANSEGTTRAWLLEFKKQFQRERKRPLCSCPSRTKGHACGLHSDTNQMLILATWVSPGASLPTYKTGQRIPVEAAACGVAEEPACWVEILFLLPTCATPDPLHRLFEPQFCSLLNGNHEDTHVGVLCLHLYVFRRLVNGSASKQKAGFPWPTKTESCTFGPGLTSAWLVPPLAQCQVLWVFFFFSPQASVPRQGTLGRVRGQ